MACSNKELEGCSVAASDGDVGHVRDVRFDDGQWRIEQLVVDTGGWLAGRRTSIPAQSVRRLDRQARRLEAALTRDQIEHASGDASGELRSGAELSGCAAIATDGSIGHVDEFLFDEQSWQIQAVVIDTRSWWPGGQVLVDAGAIDAIDWGGRELRLALTREAVRSMHPYRPPERVKGEDEGLRNVTLR